MGRVVVVGAGVTGLTCAVRLAEAGHRVDLLARDLPLETTSVVAAALWYPYKALPQDRVTAWAATAYDCFAELAAAPGTGVRMLGGTEVLLRRTEDPWWQGAVPDLTRVGPPTGVRRRLVVHRAGHRHAGLPALAAVPARGARRHGDPDEPGALPTAEGPDEVVVDCSGLGARLLAQDTDVHPVRGQVVLVEGVDLDRWWLDSEGPTYVVPRGRHVVLGGTDEEGEWSRTPTRRRRGGPARASRLVPELAGARVVAHRVGLRPVRSEVRLEAEGRTVHCYGQGGAGVTLSWGCAAEVVDLVDALT